MFGFDRCRSLDHHARFPSWSLIFVGAISLIGMSQQLIAQVGVNDYLKPILVRNGSAHFATIKDLAFHPSGKELFSAGFDKVIHVWDTQGGSQTPIRTIRPPIFRGENGQIRTISLSTREIQGQRLLAVAGCAAGDQGTIALLRYPGRDAQKANGTGEIFGFLKSHRAIVTKVLFDESGRYLVSADMAGAIRVWDLGVNPDQIADLTSLKPIRQYENTRPITSMLLRGDRSIITSDDSGQVRRRDRSIENENSEVLFDLKPPGYVRCLAGNDAQAWFIAGTTGDLGAARRPELWQVFLDPRTPAKPLASLDGIVLAADLSADGKRLAVSEQKKIPASRADRPTIDGCTVKVFEIVAEKLVSPRIVHQASSLVEAVRFAPDSSLAFAGDTTQMVALRAGERFDQSRLEVSGDGSVIWDVGFVDGLGNERAIAFSRDPRHYDGLNKIGNYEGFNLTRRVPSSFPAATLFKPDPSTSPIKVVPLDAYTFRVSWTGFSKDIALVAEREGRWYSYSLISQSAGQFPLLAIGLDTGIVVFSVETGNRTRFLIGHEDRVTALGVSRDSKWLVSGSADQSLRLWEIKNFDRVTPFGATVQPRNGQWLVTNVVPKGDAEERGLRAGDVIERAVIDLEGKALPKLEDVKLDRLIELAEASQPGREIYLLGHRAGGEPLAFRTRKRQSPTLSFFADRTQVKDWVLWAPKGIYATSIAGDGRYLGWHENKRKIGKEDSLLFTDTEKTIFSSVAVFKQDFEKPGEIDRILASEVPPLKIEPEKVLKGLVEAPVIDQKDGEVFVYLPAGGDLARLPDVEIFVDARALRLDGLDPEVQWEPVPTGWRGRIGPKVLEPSAPNAMVWVRRVNPASDRVTKVVAIASRAANAGPRRLFLFASGVEKYPVARLPDVKFAGEDVGELLKSFEERIGRSKGEEALEADLRLEHTLVNTTIKTFESEFKKLEQIQFQQGDRLLIILEGRTYFRSSEEGQILLSDSSIKAPGVKTDDFAKKLAAIASKGCRVYLFLDDIHVDLKPPDRDERQKWIQQLLEAGVCCFMASEVYPSYPRSDDDPSTIGSSRLFSRSLQSTIEANRKSKTFTEFAKDVRDQAKQIENRVKFDSTMIQVRMSDKANYHELFLWPKN